MVNTISRDEMLSNLKTSVLIKNKDADINKLERAFNLAYDKHSGQKRNSGEDYIIHPYKVALILIDLNMDLSTIIAGLLHDVVEDTETSIEDIEKCLEKTWLRLSTELPNLLK